MTNVLVLKTSIAGDAGQSSSLIEQLIGKLNAQSPKLEITTRTLDASMPHLDGETFAAFAVAPDARTPEQQQKVALSDELVAELKAADHIIIGMPMYNFGVPSAFKAWVDHIARAGVTFNYTAEGVKGLTGVENAWFIHARGGQYSGTDLDSQSAWINTFFGFLGIANIEHIYAEGLARSEGREAALARAATEVDALADRITALSAG